MVKTIICSFEDSSLAEVAISTLYNKFQGGVRITYALPAHFIPGNLMSNTLACPTLQTLTVHCTHTIFDKVVQQLGGLGVQSIRY